MGKYLPRSETFTYELIRSLTSFEQCVLTTSTENLDLFPARNLIVAKSEDEYFMLAKKAGVDLILAHFGPVGLAGMQVGLLNSIPSLTIFHGYDVSMLLLNPRWVEHYRTLFEFSSHCICISDVGRQRLIGIGCPPEKVSAIHLGVDIGKFAYQDRAPALARRGQKRLLMVSRLAEKKGIPVAMRALRAVLEQAPELTLRIVGEGEERPKIEELRRELGLERHVELVGALDSDGVRQEMAGCHLLLQPSVTARDGDQEGIPVVLMEALASGIPVIATRHSGIPELVIEGRTGFLVPEHDIPALAKTVLRVIQDPALASSLGRAGRAWIEQEFNLTLQAERFTRLLMTVLQRHGDSAPLARRSSGGNGMKILFLRSVPVRAALVKLLILKRRYPSSQITVLTTEVSRDGLAKCPVVDHAISCPGERFDLKNITAALRKAFRQQGFDRVVVPYANEDGAGYENVREVAMACGGREVVAMPWSQNEILLAGQPAQQVQDMIEVHPS